MQRSAPDGGYEFEAKVNYRKKIWQTFRRVHGRNASTSNVMLMPSAEGSEINIAKSYGYKMFRMHVVDRNAAIVANLKRRFPAVTTYGVGVDSAVARAVSAGVRIDAIHLDFCGNLGPPTFEALYNVASALDTTTKPLVAVNVLRGREGNDVSAGMRTVLRAAPRMDGELAVTPSSLFPTNLTELDHGRLTMICLTLSGLIGQKQRFSTAMLACGTYGSTAGSQTMLWSIWMCLGKDVDPSSTFRPRQLQALPLGEPVVENAL